MYVNKGDEENPEYRARLVAKEINKYKRMDMFAATPPLEAKKMLMQPHWSKKNHELRYVHWLCSSLTVCPKWNFLILPISDALGHTMEVATHLFTQRKPFLQQKLLVAPFIMAI